MRIATIGQGLSALRCVRLEKHGTYGFSRKDKQAKKETDKAEKFGG